MLLWKCGWYIHECNVIKRNLLCVSITIRRKKKWNMKFEFEYYNLSAEQELRTATSKLHAKVAV